MILVKCQFSRRQCSGNESRRSQMDDYSSSDNSVGKFLTNDVLKDNSK